MVSLNRIVSPIYRVVLTKILWGQEEEEDVEKIHGQIMPYQDKPLAYSEATAETEENEETDLDDLTSEYEMVLLPDTRAKLQSVHGLCNFYTICDACTIMQS